MAVQLAKSNIRVNAVAPGANAARGRRHYYYFILQAHGMSFPHNLRAVFIIGNGHLPPPLAPRIVGHLLSPAHNAPLAPAMKDDER